MKFAFKTEKPTGMYKSFYPNIHTIKYKKCEVGNISDELPYTIRLMVVKSDINEDGNPNCDWKWITINKKSISLQDAKDFLNSNIENILSKYELKQFQL